jgi:5'/3'-nucleotidase SurE
VGAALEAAILGTSALCLSQQTPTGSFSVNDRDELGEGRGAYDFRFTAQHGAAIAECMLRAETDDPVVLNVNYPAGAPAGAAVVARPGRREYPRAPLTDWAETEEAELYLFGEPNEVIPDTPDGLDTDIAALRAGHISITPLSFAVALADLPPALQPLLNRMTAMLAAGTGR